MPLRALLLRLALGVAALTAAAGTRAQETFVIPLAEDTLLYVENRGVTRILADLNGYPFKLVTDPDEAARSQGAYLIPREGALTIDIAAYMRPGFDANVVTFMAQGPAGTDWEFVLAPVYVEGQAAVAHTLGDLGPYPGLLRLRHPRPNPSAGPVPLAFTVPAERTTGVPLRLAVYDALGREVAVLAEGTYYPGAFEVAWDGRGRGGGPAADGVYLVGLDADGTRWTRRISRLR
jgi:hypothetical protein